MKQSAKSIVNIMRGCNLAMATNHLPGEVALRISQLERVSKKLLEPIPDVLDKIEKDFESRISATDNANEIEKLNAEKAQAIENVYSAEYTLDIAPFKASDFFAKRTIRYVVSIPGDKKPKQEITEIPEGQSLVPPMFFSLMGDFITE